MLLYMHPYNIHDVYNTYTYIFDMMSFSNIFTLQNFIKNLFYKLNLQLTWVQQITIQV